MLPGGYKISPHWHSQDEYLTVISGTLYLGMGDRYEPSTARGLAAMHIADAHQGYLRWGATAKAEDLVEKYPDLFARAGSTVYDTAWFGGHHTPGYSVLFPPLGALLGPLVVGALEAVATSALFAALARRHWGGGAALWGAVWLGVGTGTLLNWLRTSLFSLMPNDVPVCQ